MEVKSVYFLGIGGIGMSALARYFLHEGKRVGGYDLTQTPLTLRLESEGADIHYSEDVDGIGEAFRDAKTTLVVFTPAIPSDNRELLWFSEHGFHIEKRSEMLGHISENKFVMAVAGTHGKTTTTTMTAWLNHICTGGGGAFLGGISKNFDSNLVMGRGSRLAVEADEFDRSFLRLNAHTAVVTSVDADHLDIYGTYEAVKEAFTQFTDRIKKGGAVILNKQVDIEINNKFIDIYSYSLDDTSTHFHTQNLRLHEDGYYRYDIVMPDATVKGCRLGITGKINVENSIAAVALMWSASKMRPEPLDHDKLRQALASFSGVKRRFDLYVNTPKGVYMDDYAHHPQELSSALSSLRGMFGGRKITAIFQPHLYTRTRDLYREFAEALSIADEVILLPIYPARELPIEGVDSEMIGKFLTVPRTVIPKERVAEAIAAADTDIVVTFGAGNIENICEEIAQVVRNKTGTETETETES